MNHAEDPGDALIHELPGIALSLEADGRIRYANAHVRTALGHEPGHLTGQLLQDLVHPEDRPRVAAAIAAPRQPGEAGPTPCRLRHADGTWRVLELTVSAGRQLPLAALAISRESGVGPAAAAQPGPSRIAHDLNNHLSTILGFTELLLADLPETDPYREDLEEIHKAGKSAQVITSRLAELLRPRGDS